MAYGDCRNRKTTRPETSDLTKPGISRAALAITSTVCFAILKVRISRTLSSRRLDLSDILVRIPRNEFRLRRRDCSCQKDDRNSGDIQAGCRAFLTKRPDGEFNGWRIASRSGGPGTPLVVQRGLINRRAVERKLALLRLASPAPVVLAAPANRLWSRRRCRALGRCC